MPARIARFRQQRVGVDWFGGDDLFEAGKGLLAEASPIALRALAQPLVQPLRDVFQRQARA